MVHRAGGMRDASQIGMPDNTTLRQGPDRVRISLQQDHEVKYWTQALGVTKEQLEQAVKAVGNGVEDVRKYLGDRRS